METAITDVDEFRAEHSHVHIENMGRREILSVSESGVLHVGNPDRPDTVNISDPDVTVL